MSPGGRAIRVSLAGTDLAVAIDLLDEENPESVAALWDALPIESSFGHTVVSGGGIWIPTTIVHIGRTVPRERTVGSVYLYGPMQIIAMTYGQISESAHVNEVGRVRQADLPVLTKIGKIVWDRTIASGERLLTPVVVERSQG
ncbi:MAG: DUF3830 family protein [Bifidobacteriaceae bacterium]|jgi:hypothetical protein|nr:DUF3830 family protein [Bifidobacteriaceae bacterium]